MFVKLAACGPLQGEGIYKDAIKDPECLIIELLL